MPVHEQRAKDVEDVVAPAEIHEVEGFDHIEHAAGVHVEPEPSQQPFEDEQPRQQRVARAGAHASCAARAVARASRSAMRPPRIASTSSRAFSTTPIVSSIAASVT